MLLSEVIERIHYRGPTFEVQHVVKHPTHIVH